MAQSKNLREEHVQCLHTGPTVGLTLISRPRADSDLLITVYNTNAQTILLTCHPNWVSYIGASLMSLS